ncbi:MAG: T9SS type A sorting domain-containing protein [Ignavibacteriaceae bacterium]|nr:T9SS type A sorting domain-containing protein [Ignavibacteriaceae bacterium]
MNKIFTTLTTLFLMLVFNLASSAQPIFTEDFESGSAHPDWEAFFPNEEIVVAASMTNPPLPLPTGGDFVGWLQDTDTSYTGVAVSIIGETSLQEYSIEADVYCYVNHPGGSAYTGVVVYADSSIGTYIKLAADFDPVPYPRIRLYNNHFDLGTFSYTFEHSFAESDIPGGIPTEDGWHKLKLEVRTINSDITAFWCYWDGVELLGCPVTDTSSHRMSSGQYGLFSFSQGTGEGIPGYYDNIVVESLVSSVEDNSNENLPEEYVLEQNYPNPFNPETKISYQLSSGSYVTLSIHDLLGREIKTLFSEDQPSGNYSVSWNGRDKLGNIVPSGVYLYSLRTDGQIISKKMMLMK